MKAFMQSVCGGASLVLWLNVYSLLVSQEDAASTIGGDFQCFYITRQTRIIKIKRRMKKSKEKQRCAVLGSYVWDWHCRRRSNK